MLLDFLRSIFGTTEDTYKNQTTDGEQTYEAVASVVEDELYDAQCQAECDGDAWHSECDCIGDECEDGCDGF